MAGRTSEDELGERWAALVGGTGSKTAPDGSLEAFVGALEGYAVFLLDSGGRVTSWNAGAEHILGHSSADVIGQHLSRFYRAESVAAGVPERALAKAREHGRLVQEGWRVRRDGSLLWANVILQAVHREGRLARFGVLLRDDTERKRVQDETVLARELALAIASASSIEDALALALRKICETADWQIGEAWIRDGDELECSTAWYASSEDLNRFRRDAVGFRIRPGTGLPGVAWSAGKPIWMKDVVSDPRFLRFALARKLGIAAGMAVPISSGDQVVAVLVFFVFEAREEDEALIELVSGIGAQLGALIARRRAEDVLEESEARYRLLAENSTDLISVTRPDGVLTYVSPACRALLGWEPDEVLGTGAFDYVHPDDLPELTPVFVSVLKGPGLVTTPPYRVRRGDGSYVWIESTVRQIRDPTTGEVVELQAAGRDVTERKNAEEALRESDLLKTTLLRAVSHDFRSPLTAIIAAAEASESPTIGEEGRKELTSVILSQGTRLSGLVDKLLDLSRLQAGVAAPRRLWCSVEELLDAALEHVAGDVGRFELSIEPRLPNVLVDPAQLERALANLFDNARRYAEGVPVEVSAGAEQGRLRMRVTDRGPGIPPEEREKVFEPFYRGEAPGAHGSGLGLAIVKGFVELNGGRVFVEPAEPGPGSTFVIELGIEAEPGDQHPAS